MSHLSLRDRKRAETWAALHQAAAVKALESGLDSVHVDAVAEAAGVSARTFFNYFACKEDAVLGLREPRVEEAMLADFDIDGDLLEEVSGLMLSVMRTIQGGEESNQLRGLVLEKYPLLVHRRFHYVLKVEQLVTAVVREALAGSARWRNRSPEALAEGHTEEDVARTMVLVAGTGVRYAMQKTWSNPTHEAQLRALGQGLDLTRSVLKELS